jgi:hypothetical protein
MARAKYFLAAAFLVGLAIFGRRYHWIEAANTAERDGFVDKAELILHGQFPRDALRPPLYPLLAAGLAPLLGGPFVAARLISNLAACGLALLAFGFGARLRNERVGLWSMALVLANANVWIYGEQVTTDMLFACFAAGALLAGLAYLERPSARTALAAGVAYALGAWVRGNAALLLPALFLAYFLAPRARASGRLLGGAQAAETAEAGGTSGEAAGGRSPAHLGFGVVAAVLLLVPLWWLRWRNFGSPFYDENWRNLWWKLHAHSDWSLLDRAPRTSFGRIVLNEPTAVGASMLRELAKFPVGALPDLVGGWWCVPPLVLAAVASIRMRSRDRLYLWFALGTFTLGVAAVFFTWGRFMLLWIPIASALSIAECHRLAEKVAARRGGRWGISVGAAASGALVALTFASTAFWQLPRFVRQHPYGEVRALTPVDRELGAGDALAGTAWFLQRYFKHHYVRLPDDTSLVGVGEDRIWCEFERLFRSEHVKYLAVSEVELRQGPRGLLGGGKTPVPPWLELVRKDPQVTLWHVLEAGSAPRAQGPPPCP